MRPLLFCSFLLTLMGLSCRETSSAPTAFCDSWPVGQTKESTQKINQVVDAFARTLDPKRPMRDNAQAIAQWLEQQPCIRQVGIANDVVATEPPGLDLTVFHRDGSQRTFSLLFGKDRVRLSNSY